MHYQDKHEESNLTIMDLYSFEYRFLPRMVYECSLGLINRVQIEDKESIIYLVYWNCDSVEWNWEEFNATKQIIGDKDIVLYTFPEPTITPLAKFAAVIESGAELAYYTLELDKYKNKTTWYLCRQTIEQHFNMGPVEACETINDFSGLIQKTTLAEKDNESEETLE